MNKYGYIKQSRSALAEELEGAKSTVLMRLCLQAAYYSTIHPKCGKIEPGELITSRKQLAKQTGLSEDQVKRALRSLVEGKYIAIESTPRYTKIAVIWGDFVSLRDNHIILNTQVSAQATPTTSNCDADSCEDKKESVPNQPPKSAPNNYIKLVENNNTHTSNSIYPVRTKSAPARECAPASAYASTQPAEVVELQEWIMRNVPDFYAMPQPFTAPQLRRMIERYPMADIQRLLVTAWSKAACVSHRVAYAAFRSFADNDRILLARTREDKAAEKLYTYEEMADFVWRNGVASDKYFRPIKQDNGKTLFQKIC